MHLEKHSESADLHQAAHLAPYCHLRVRVRLGMERNLSLTALMATVVFLLLLS